MKPIGAARAGLLSGRQVQLPSIHQYLYDDFTTSNWPDSEGTDDLSTITGLTADSSAFSSTGGVSGDGTDDYAQDGAMTYLENNYYSEWAWSFGISTTDDGVLLSGMNDVNDRYNNFIFPAEIGNALTAGHIGTERSYQANAKTVVESDVAINDGGNYVVIIQSTGPTASDIEIYFEPSVNSATVVQSGYSGDGSEVFDMVDMTYFARNDQGTIDLNFNGTTTDIRWFDSALSSSERGAVFDKYAWYDPSTDSP